MNFAFQLPPLSKTYVFSEAECKDNQSAVIHKQKITFLSFFLFPPTKELRPVFKSDCKGNRLFCLDKGVVDLFCLFTDFIRNNQS